MSKSILIQGGTVVNADREFKADVLCVDGVIAAVGDDAASLAPAGTQKVDASGQYVVPGGIDPHTHMQLPFMGTVRENRSSSCPKNCRKMGSSGKGDMDWRTRVSVSMFTTAEEDCLAIWATGLPENTSPPRTGAAGAAGAPVAGTGAAAWDGRIPGGPAKTRTPRARVRMPQRIQGVLFESFMSFTSSGPPAVPRRGGCDASSLRV